MANITPFSGSSRTLASVTNGGGSGGADILEALKNIYADEEVMRDWARESGLGYENFMTVDDKFKVIPCVPKRTRSKIADLFLNDYKSGKLPSKGFMKIPQILTRVARTCASDVAGLIAVSLRDSAHPTEAVDGQRYIVPLTALPAVFAFAPTFDLPLDKIGNETRSFFIAAELIAVTGHKGSVAAINNFWSVEFSMKCGNYTRKKPGVTFILPHDRLAALPEEVLRGFVKGCLDYSTHPAFMQATRALNGPDPEVGLSSEPNKPQISDGEVSEIGKVPEGLTSLAGIHMGSTPATVSL